MPKTGDLSFEPCREILRRNWSDVANALLRLRMRRDQRARILNQDWARTGNTFRYFSPVQAATNQPLSLSPFLHSCVPSSHSRSTELRLLCSRPLPADSRRRRATLKRRLRVRARPGVPLDHHARQPAKRLTLAWAGNRPPDDRPARACFLIHPRRIQDRSDRRFRVHWLRVSSFRLGRIGRRRSGTSIPENDSLSCHRNSSFSSPAPCRTTSSGQARLEPSTVRPKTRSSAPSRGSGAGRVLARFGERRCRDRLRLKLGDHRVGHRARIGLQPRPPIGLDASGSA